MIRESAALRELLVKIGFLMVLVCRVGIEFDYVGWLGFVSVGAGANARVVYAGLRDFAQVVASVSLDCSWLCNGWGESGQRES